MNNSSDIFKVSNTYLRMFIYMRRSGIPELQNRVKKPSYGLWRHKTELSQIVTSSLIFRNSEIVELKNENKKTELLNSEILYLSKFPIYITLTFKKKKKKIKDPSYITRTSDKTSDRTNVFITGLEWKYVTVSKFQHLTWNFSSRKNHSYFLH